MARADRSAHTRDGYVDIVELERASRNPSSRRAPQVWGSEDPGEPGWWVRRLLNSLQHRVRLHELLWSYYEGRHPLPWIHDIDLVPQFDRLQRIARTNYLALILEALEERLDVEGFRFGDATGADEDAWEIWQANDLDELSQLAHVMALVTGTSYTLTWPGADGPDVWIEDSLTMVHEWDTSKPRGRHVASALKAWHDDAMGVDRLELYLPDGIHRWRMDSSNPDRTMWVPDGGEDADFEPLPEQFVELGGADGPMVPVTPLVARPDRHRNGRSELIEAIPVQDRINQTLFDRLVAQSYSSFQQIIGIGVAPDHDPETGQEVNPLQRKPGRAWLIDEGGSVDTVEPQSIQQMLDAVDQDVSAMARLARTPPNYLSAKMQFPSGDAIRSAEAGLVKKAERRTRQLGGGWERTMRLSLAASDRMELARQSSAETKWANVEIRTEGELMDALVKAATLEVPVEALWERWGATQSEIARWRRQRRTDQLLGALRPVPDTPMLSSDTAGDDDLVEEPAA